jgi:hypothetical protein
VDLITYDWARNYKHLKEPAVAPGQKANSSLATAQEIAGVGILRDECSLNHTI